MSSNLMWKPIRDDGESLPDSLKFALRKRFGNGTIKEAELDSDDISYLTGLADCGIVGANELIDLIEKHGKVSIWEQF